MRRCPPPPRRLPPAVSSSVRRGSFLLTVCAACLAGCDGGAPVVAVEARDAAEVSAEPVPARRGAADESFRPVPRRERPRRDGAVVGAARETPPPLVAVAADEPDPAGGPPCCGEAAGAAAADDEPPPASGPKWVPLPLVEGDPTLTPVSEFHEFEPIFAAARERVLAHLDQKLRRASPRPPSAGRVARPLNRAGRLADYMKDDVTPAERVEMLAEDLRLATAQLAHEDLEVKRSGLGLGMNAVFVAAKYLKDPELEAAIADGWLTPNLRYASADGSSIVSADWLLIDASRAYEHAGQYEKQLHAARLWLQIDFDHQNAADTARFKISRALAGLGRYEEAIATLEEISDETGMAGAKTGIPALRKKLAEQRRSAPSPEPEPEPEPTR